MIIIPIFLLMCSHIVFAMNMTCDFKCLGEMYDDEYKENWDFKNVVVIQGNLEKGIGKIDSSNSVLYIHYDKSRFKKYSVAFGDYNVLNSADLVEKFMPPVYKIYEIQNDTNKPMFLIIKGYAHIANAAIEVISCNEYGKWFSYFDSMENLQSYGHHVTDSNVIRKLRIEKDYIVITYLTRSHSLVNGKSVSKPVEYELIYRWDETAKWFSISHRIVNDNPSTQFSPIKCYSNGYNTTL